MPDSFLKHEPQDLVQTIYKEILTTYPFLTQKQQKEFIKVAAQLFIDKDKVIDQPISTLTTLLKLINYGQNNWHGGIVTYKEPKNRPKLQTKKPPLFTHRITRNILHLTVPSWENDPQLAQDLIDVCTINQNKYQTIIIDVRQNSGGNSTIAHKFVGIFFKKDIHFGKFIRKDKKGELETINFILPANKKIYIDKPIAILISSKCFSSNELFIAPFKISKRATLVGTKTKGGSANAKEILIESYGKKYRVRIPRWRFFLKGEKKPLEETAIKPDIVYTKPNIISYTQKILNSK